MQTITNTALALAMLAAFLLIMGSYFAWRRQGDRKRGILMLVAAIVLIANVAIWTV
jgi:drug/metabolite transporter superfamily protein YnfA